MSSLQPLPDRECGECRVCCVELGIDDPELQKADEVACPNMSIACGCLIYVSRPRACRDWFCGWRMMPLSEAMRPDRSGVLLVPEIGGDPRYAKGGLKFLPLEGRLSGVLASETVDLAGRCVAADVPIYLSYGAGTSCKRLLVNPLLKPAVQAGDKAAFEAIFVEAFRRMMTLTEAEKSDAASMPPQEL